MANETISLEERRKLEARLDRGEKRIIAEKTGLSRIAVQRYFSEKYNTSLGHSATEKITKALLELVGGRADNFKKMSKTIKNL
jgi:hypothetical protein